MNKLQKSHSKHIRDTFAKLQEAKYTAGAKEHGTILPELDLLYLLEQAREEFIDGFTYVQTVIDIFQDQVIVDINSDDLLKYFEKLKSTTDKASPK